ncbi:MAG: hypothetical protein H7252_05720 [Cytophaga sp.]|nr:hypothetical protein [Undibacterium sp.]
MPPVSYSDYIHANAHVVSWASILVGASTAAVLSLILLMLGTGLGLSSISPWSHAGISASGFGVSTIIWVAVTQIIAAGMGGYLSGRLRTKWAGVHSDEVHFRDTAHGFMAWAVATLATTALLASAIGNIATGAAHAGAGATSSTATAALVGGAAKVGSEMDGRDSVNESGDGTTGYFIDALFRPVSSTPSLTKSATVDHAQNAAILLEVTRIFVHSMNTKILPPPDATYVGQLVAQRTGLNQQDAEKRVNDNFANLQKKTEDAKIKVREAADKLRKVTIYATLWLFVSLLMGAFSASLAATWGGRSRDA